MNAKALMFLVGALVLGPAANAANEIDFAMEIINPQTSIMDVGLADADVMTAYMQPMFESIVGGGKVVHKGWFDNRGDYRQSFVIVVGVHVPSEIPGFATLEEAAKTDVRVRISSNGIATAECLLAYEPVISRSAAYFAVDLSAIGDEVKPNSGICDVDLNQAGLQVGIPLLNHKDHLVTYVRGKPYGEFEFLDGYCY